MGGVQRGCPHLAVYAIIKFPLNGKGDRSGTRRAVRTLSSNTSRVSVIVGVKTMGGGGCSLIARRVTILGRVTNSGVLGIVIRAYCLARRRGVHLYRYIAGNKTSCVGASAKFNARNTSLSSVTLFEGRVKGGMGVGTTKKVHAERSVRTFLATNTSHVNTDKTVEILCKRWHSYFQVGGATDLVVKLLSFFIFCTHAFSLWGEL